jgi:hypothetical protein
VWSEFGVLRIQKSVIVTLSGSPVVVEVEKMPEEVRHCGIEKSV